MTPRQDQTSSALHYSRDAMPSENAPTADTRDTTGDDYSGLITAGSLILVTAISFTLMSHHHTLARAGANLMETVRKRAAAVICVGIMIVAADRLVIGDLVRRDHFWRDMHEDGWIALVGVAIALIGLYHWITEPTHKEK